MTIELTTHAAPELPADPMVREFLLRPSREIPVVLLCRLLHYAPDTGRFFWKHRPASFFRDTAARTAADSAKIWNARDAWTEALTSTDKAGRRSGRILGVGAAAHRVAFAMHNGFWAVGLVDHANGDPSDNRAGNLRDATRAQNGQNARSKGGTSQYCGVSFDRRDNLWRVQCAGSAGQSRHIGLFQDEIDAAKAYDAAARERHGSFAKTNFSGVE